VKAESKLLTAIGFHAKLGSALAAIIGQSEIRSRNRKNFSKLFKRFSTQWFMKSPSECLKFLFYGEIEGKKI
jgi:hypothetical protein